LIGASETNLLAEVAEIVSLALGEPDSLFDTIDFLEKVDFFGSR
jgi:hypothetical protein